MTRTNAGLFYICSWSDAHHYKILLQNNPVWRESLQDSNVEHLFLYDVFTSYKNKCRTILDMSTCMTSSLKDCRTFVPGVTHITTRTNVEHLFLDDEHVIQDWTTFVLCMHVNNPGVSYIHTRTNVKQSWSELHSYKNKCRTILEWATFVLVWRTQCRIESTFVLGVMCSLQDCSYIWTNVWRVQSWSELHSYKNKCRTILDCSSICHTCTNAEESSRIVSYIHTRTNVEQSWSELHSYKKKCRTILEWTTFIQEQM